MPRKEYSKTEMFDDLDPKDENTDPEFLEECYEMYEATGCTPDNIKDPVKRKNYEKWLKKKLVHK